MKFLLICLFLYPLSVYSFRLNTNTAAAFGDKNIKIYVTSNSTCSEAGISKEDLLDLAVKGARDFWNKVPTSNINIERGGILQTSNNLFLTGALCASDSQTSCPEATSVPTSIDDIVIACNNNTTDNFKSGSYLALSAPVRVSNQTIKGSIVLINDSTNTSFDTLTYNERLSVLAHEIGHAVGIGHSNKDEALMYYANSDKLSKLSQDDIDAITYLYPNRLDGCGGFFGGTIGKDTDPPIKQNLLMSLLLGACMGWSLLIFTKFFTALKRSPRLFVLKKVNS